MVKLIIASIISLFAFTAYSSAADCRAIHQVSANMAKLGYLDDWEGNNNRDVLTSIW